MAINFKHLLYSDVGRIVISILLGVGLSCLFFKACKDKDCIAFSGPVLKDVEGKIFKHDDKCYTYKIQSTFCDKKKETVAIGERSEP